MKQDVKSQFHQQYLSIRSITTLPGQIDCHEYLSDSSTRYESMTLRTIDGLSIKIAWKG